ncbi:sensor domain-containing diguanylate cyclase [Sulfurospirillum multivorans]|uniref:diguanylate cyclase n=2 Tax=Sulfurospirillum multivorans TaxID=66821 RepID=A0AA86AQ03_SULMK|nr:sensor domain-containing diguanylate cyclase [Sulfurospirillum multivorans]AHJ14329.1 diguanylate cyclase [Sulfurospirillum multivorans DSM 12446]QEH07815.1 diguanylate cyclase [Sulfurospirillum multivorans]
MRLKTKVVLIIAGLLLGVSITGSIINYLKNVRDTQAQLQNTSLPLSVDNIYTEIQQRMIEPLLVSSLMSHDTFLRDWLMEGETDMNGIVRYLTEIQQKYDIFTTFLVSDKTKNYYHARGLIDVVNKENSADAWYFRFMAQPEPYEINLDYNANLSESLIMFINYKVMNYKNEIIGATGVGVKIMNIEAMLNSFKTKYKYDVYFVSESGEITLFAKGLNKRGNISTIEGLKEIKESVFKGEKSQFEYKGKEGEYLLNTKYIDKLKLHLFVEINKKEYINEIKKTFYVNLSISLLVTLLVTLIIIYTINIYQNQLVQLANEDALTGLANRRKFNEQFEKRYKLYKKGVNRLTLLLIDIDDFKEVNDTFGHLVGDDTLMRVAEILRTELRVSDIIARWGGEEFALLLVDVLPQKAMEIAQKICHAIREDALLQDMLQQKLTVSIGLGELTSLESQDGLVHKVDLALYEAKKAGKDQVIVA